MDTEKKPIVDQITDMAAQAAGNLAETGVRAVAKKATQEIPKRLPRTVKKAGRAIVRAAKPRAAKKRTTTRGAKSRKAKRR
jgi:hypothetical protein